MGQYTLEALLGQGAFGKVYRARLVGSDGFERSVAIKVLHPDRVDDGELARLRDEARLLGLLHHRAIVQVHELFRSDDGWAVVMELVGGVDLHRVVRGGAVPATVALGIVGEVAAALDVATSTEVDGRPLRLCHRDIKPANLRLTEGGDVKVLDFGIARADFGGREARTETDQVFGTLRYMSPERLAGQSLPAGDVYALGIVLVELLGGQFGRGGLLADRHRDLVQGAVAGLAPDLAALATAMLDADPARRPTAGEVRDRCHRLARTAQGPSVAAWAAAHVPALAAAAAADTDDQRLGTRLSSGVSRQDPPTATIGWVALLGAVGSSSLVALLVGVVLTAAVAVGAWFALRSEPPARWDVTLVRQELAARADDVVPVGDGRLLLVRDGRCWLAGPGGVDPVALSPADRACATPVATPDGSRVAMWVDGGLVLWTPDGSRTLREAGIPVGFDPSGATLAWLKTDRPDANGRVSRSELRLCAADGSADRALLEDTDVRSAIWTPDGSALIAWSGDDWTRVAVAGGPPTRIRATPRPWVLSPDGGTLFASRGSEERPEVVAYALDRDGRPTGEPSLQLSLDGAAVLRSSADHRALTALVRTRSVAVDAWRVTADGFAEERSLRPPPVWQEVLPVRDGYVLVARIANPGADGGTPRVEHRLARWDGRGEPEPLLVIPDDLHSIGPTRSGGALLWHRRDTDELVELSLDPGATPVVRARVAELDLRDWRVDPRGERVALFDRRQRLVLTELDGDLAAALAGEQPLAVGWRPAEWLPDGSALLALDGEGRVARIDRQGLRIVAEGATWATGIDRRVALIHRTTGVERLDLVSGAASPAFPAGVKVRGIGDGRLVVQTPLVSDALYAASLVRRDR